MMGIMLLFSFAFQLFVWGVIVTGIIKAVKKGFAGRYEHEDAQKQKRAGSEEKRTKVNEHSHAYEHKVEPIDEATVMQRHYERQAEQEKKRAEREAMYNEGTRSAQNSGAYDTERGNVGRNGDYGDVPSENERVVACRYCAAKNIIPKYTENVYSCYFCRQPVE